MVMTDVGHVLTLPPTNEPLTVDDLERLPDDELIDGILLVSPGVVFLRQRVAVRLARLLADACPRQLEVVGPFSFNVSAHDFVIPDVGVVHLESEPPDAYPRDLRLAVEVLSPSTRRRDLALKKQFYADSGVPAYWVIDPAQPSLTAWHLVDGGYVQRAHVTGGDAYDATVPFPVRVVPGPLITR